MNNATIDDVKNYWNTRPCNIRHSKSEIGTRQYFDEVEHRKYFVEPHIPGFADFKKWEGKKVLEVGCGLGTDAVNFAREGADYTGVELSIESMKLAEQRFEVFGLKGRFINVNAEDLLSQLQGEKFDLVYSFGVIHHTVNPSKVIADIKQLMTDSSEFKLMMYAKDSWKSAMIDAGYDQPEAQSGCPIAFTYSDEELTELLADFEILEMRKDHIFPYVIDQYIKHEYDFQPWFKAMPQDMFRALETSFGWHKLVTCKLR
jgi:SAM-dependent methyltransferase